MKIIKASWPVLLTSFTLASGAVAASQPKHVYGSQSSHSAAGDSTKHSQTTGTAGEASESENIKTESIRFTPGSYKLTPAHQKKLRQFVEKSRQSGELQGLTVVVWSDKPFPAKDDASLPEVDREMAKQRGETVKNYLESDLNANNVEVVTMAERPNIFAKFFDAAEAKLKEQFSSGSSEDQRHSRYAMKLREANGGPSAAVVIAMIQEPQVSTSGTATHESSKDKSKDASHKSVKEKPAAAPYKK